MRCDCCYAKDSLAQTCIRGKASRQLRVVQWSHVLVKLRYRFQMRFNRIREASEHSCNLHNLGDKRLGGLSLLKRCLKIDDAQEFVLVHVFQLTWIDKIAGSPQSNPVDHDFTALSTLLYASVQ